MANQTSTTLAALRYMDTGPAGVMCAGQSNLITSLSTSTVYAAALIQAMGIKLGPEDAWGNVKIPRIESLDISNANSDGWIPFIPDSAESYSSLLGIPIVGIPTTGSTGLTLESSYITLDCPSVVSNASFNASSGNTLTIICDHCPNASVAGGWQNGSFTKPQIDRIRDLLGVSIATASNSSGESFSQVIDFYSINSNGINPLDPTVATPIPYTHVQCTASQSHVETMVNCTNNSCHVSAIRYSLTDHRPSNITLFDYWGSFAISQINAASTSNSDQGLISSPSQLFINDSSILPVAPNYQPTAFYVNLSYISRDLFAARASMLLNTYLQLVISSTGFAGDLPDPKDVYYGPKYTVPATALNASEFPFNNPDWSPDLAETPGAFGPVMAPFVAASTMATVSTAVEVYRADYPWIIALFISSLIVLLLGLGGIVLNHFTIAPDLFDPVAGWTYDNLHLGIPSTGTTIDREKRIQILSNITVKVGDVCAERKVGKVGIGREENTRKFQEGRLYV